MTLDSRGRKYELPVYVINEAEEYGSKEHHTPVPAGLKNEQLTIVIRSAARGDVSMTVGSLTRGRDLKIQYQTATAAQKPPRLFYCGREIKDDVVLAQRQVVSGVVIQAMGS